MSVIRGLRLSQGMLVALGAAACVSIGPRAATAQQAAQPSATGDRSSIDRAVTEVRQLLDEQRRLLEAQARVIEAQGRDIADLQRRLDGVAPGSGAQPAPSPGQVSGGSGQVAAGQAGPETPPVNINPELPAAVVSAGDFPKSIGIPGTDAAFRIGGQARLMMVHSMGPLGTDDRFVTSSIPAEGQQQSGEDKRINYSAAASRANLDVRAPTSRGSIRTFLESDFAGESRTLRLRHAFIQNDRWLGGQTWSTFSDPEAEPLGIDFEGLNAISLFRQPQLRYNHPLGQSINVAVALENPAPDLTGASGVSVIPDFIARVRWQPQRPRPLLGRAEHIQTAVLVRGLRGEVADRPETTLSTVGFGMNVSGVIIPRWDHDDRVKFAANGGWGIGRYITDLGSLGGQDGVYDSIADSLRALPVSSAYVGYERMWSPTFTTAVTYGLVNVSNLDIQPDTALRRTHRSTINLTWNPIPQASLVLEFLGGTRLNKDRQQGSSSQIQAGWLVVF